MSVCLSVFLSMCLAVHPSVRLSVWFYNGKESKIVRYKTSHGVEGEKILAMRFKVQPDTHLGSISVKASISSKGFFFNQALESKAETSD